MAAFMILLDQLTKSWIVANFSLYETRTPIPALKEVFNMTYTQNTGAAFGMFQSAGNFFLIVAVVATVVIFYYYRQIRGSAWLMRGAMGLQLGGALGNAFDRITRGYVVDFLHVFYDPLGFDYPIFNLADSSIVIGVVVLVILIWLEDDPTQAKTDNPPESVA